MNAICGHAADQRSRPPSNCTYEATKQGVQVDGAQVCAVIADFNLICDHAALHMSDFVVNNYVRFSEFGCQSDSDPFEACLTYGQKT